jgi:WD40 repeat protein
MSSGKEIRSFQGHTRGVNSVAFSPDGKQVLTGSQDETACLWHVSSGKQIGRFQGHIHAVTFVAFSPDGKQVVVGDETSTVRFWEMATGKERWSTSAHSDGGSSITFSPDGKRALIGGHRAAVRLFDCILGRQLCQLISFQDGTWSVIDEEGRYDSSDNGDSQWVHGVSGTNIIPLKQLKAGHYDPGLLAKYMGFNTEPLRAVGARR